MSGESATIQSLRAVDAWIDVINANINGGVRTAFKSSRLRFTGSNVDVQRAGTSTSLPLQMPEPSLTTGNTVIDFTQGAITASTENTHVALQGPGFFKVRPLFDSTAPAMYTRDGEFRWMELPASAVTANQFSSTTNVQLGAKVYILVNSNGLGVCANYRYGGPTEMPESDVFVHIIQDAGGALFGSFNTLPGSLQSFMDSEFVNNIQIRDMSERQQFTYTQYGSTIFTHRNSPTTSLVITSSQSTVLGKSLEASNASMTQSVPELSLAQKLFSALTKVLQTKQTNVDGVLNLVR